MLHGCSAERFYDQETGYLHEYCGRTHARLAAEAPAVLRFLLESYHAMRAELGGGGWPR